MSRSGFYYEPLPESEANLALMRRLDELGAKSQSAGAIIQMSMYRPVGTFEPGLARRLIEENYAETIAELYADVEEPLPESLV